MAGRRSLFLRRRAGLCTDKAAELWAEYRTFKQHSQFCALLASNISVDDKRFLNLTTYEDIRILNYIQLKCVQKLAATGRCVGFIDGFLINFAREEMQLETDAVKGNEYIQQEAADRKYNICRRISNCAICAVHNKEAITEITIEKDGESDL